MLETILANEYLIYLIALGVVLITLLICGKHYKKYGFIQAVFSILTVPMLVYGLGLVLIYVFRDNADLIYVIESSLMGLESVRSLFIELFKQLGIAWFYETAGFYLPFGVLFILSYGYSITWRKKHKKNKEQK